MTGTITALVNREHHTSYGFIRCADGRVRSFNAESTIIQRLLEGDRVQFEIWGGVVTLIRPEGLCSNCELASLT